MRGKISTRIWLVAGFLLAGLLLLMRQSLSRDAGDLFGFLKILSDNFLYYFAPQRTPPFSTEEIKVRLKTAFGEPFISFSFKEWDNFWQVIYGVYEIEKPDNPRLPLKARQLTIAEMQERLRKMYPDFFGRFTPQYWEEFWGIVLKK